MLWLLPLVLAADRQRLGLDHEKPDQFEIFVTAMQDLQNRGHYMDSMIPDWMQFLGSDEPLRYVGDHTRKYLRGKLDEKLCENLEFLSYIWLPVRNTERIGSYLASQAKKIQGTLVFALKHMPTAEGDRWIEGLTAHVDQLSENTTDFVMISVCLREKQHTDDMIDVAYVLGLLPATQSFGSQPFFSKSFGAEQVTALNAISANDQSVLNSFHHLDFAFAHLLHASHQVMGDETKEQVSLINNLMTMNMCEKVFSDNDESELPIVLSKAPVGKRVGLKFLKSHSMVDMVKHIDGHWYGIRYDKRKKKMHVFKTPHRKIGGFLYLLQKEKIETKEIFREVEGIQLRKIKERWCFHGPCWYHRIQSYCVPWNIDPERLAIGLIWEYARYLAALPKKEMLETAFQWQPFIKDLQYYSATTLHSKLSTLRCKNKKAGEILEDIKLVVSASANRD